MQFPGTVGIPNEEREYDGIQLRDEIGGECGGPRKKATYRLCRFDSRSVELLMEPLKGQFSSWMRPPVMVFSTSAT